MRLLVDENFDGRLLPFLIARDHDVWSARINYPGGLPDTQVLALALHERRVLVTNDNDFGKLVVVDRLPHAGVILLRLKPADSATFLRHIEAAISAMTSGNPQLVVVTDRRLRVR